MARKPHPQGFQVKTTACASTNIVLEYDLVEGPDIDGEKEFSPYWGKSTGTTLRLTQPFAGTGRTIIGDSWFASVNTAVALYKMGLYFVGNVKTGHFGFPLRWLKDCCTQRGDTQFARKQWPLVMTRHAD